MKLNGTPRHYMPLPQNQSDDDENGPGKEEDKSDKVCFKDTFDSSTLDTRIIKLKGGEDLKSTPMSPLRMVAFVISLLLCVLFIVVFAWLLPCKIPQDFVSTGRLTEEWTLVLHNMSSTSSVALAGQNILKNPVLIIGYANQDSDATDPAGLLALRGYDGKQLWQLSLHGTPTHCWCDAIDVDNDSVHECLVIGDKGLMTAVEATKGMSLWYLHNHNNFPAADFVYAPVVLPDCDEDGIPDIGISYVITSEINNIYVSLVSGATGKVIGSLVPLPVCAKPVSEQFSWGWQNTTVDMLFFCMDKNNIGNLWHMSAKNLCNVALNRSEDLHVKKIYKIPQAIKKAHFQMVSSTEDKKMILVLDGIRVLLLERLGPETFKMKWKQYLEGHQSIRAIAAGQYTESEDIQVVIVSSDLSGSKVTGLNITDGRELWSMKQENGTITSVLSLSKIFGEKDGLVLKTLTPHIQYRQTSDDKQVITGIKSLDKLSDISNTTDIYKEKEMPNDVNVMELFEEKYILVKCGKMAVVRTLSSQQIASVCQGTVCQPDVYTSRTNAVASILESDKALEMMVVSTSLVPTNISDSPFQIETIVKHFHLGGFLTLPRCIST